MRRRHCVRYSMLVLMIVVGFSACESREQAEFQPFTAEQITGEALWERINVKSDYHEYPQWPGHEGRKPGQAPHGVFHEIYINSTLSEALPENPEVAPNGTIIVKDSYNAEDELTAITVMAKVEGFAPDSGDWFWAVYSPVGETLRSGNVGGCVTCHAGMKDNDYIIVQRLGE